MPQIPEVCQLKNMNTIIASSRTLSVFTRHLVWAHKIYGIKPISRLLLRWVLTLGIRPFCLSENEDAAFFFFKPMCLHLTVHTWESFELCRFGFITTWCFAQCQVLWWASKVTFIHSKGSFNQFLSQSGSLWLKSYSCLHYNLFFPAFNKSKGLLATPINER